MVCPLARGAGSYCSGGTVVYETISASEPARECDVGEARRQAHEAARARWPGIELSLQQFVYHLEALRWTGDLPKHCDELYLCRACVLGVRGACRRLEREYFPALEAGLARQCRRPDFIEEVLQQVRERLLVGPAARIASFRGEGSLASWLGRVTQHLASDLYRAEKKHRRLRAARWCLVVDATDPVSLSEPRESRSMGARYLSQLERAFLGAMVQLSSAERKLLYLHYVQGLSADEIAHCMQRNRSNVYRRLNHIKARVKRWSIARAREETGVRDRDELEGLFQANCMGIYLDPIVWLDAKSPTHVIPG